MQKYFRNYSLVTIQLQGMLKFVMSCGVEPSQKTANRDSLPIRDSRPDPNVSFIQRFHCTTRDSGPDPNVSYIVRFHCMQGTVDQIPMCPLFRGSTVLQRDSRPDPDMSSI